MELKADDFDISKFLDFSPNLERSRRNLIAISAIVLVLCYINPNVTRFSFSGIDCDHVNMHKVNIVLLVGLSYELCIFLIRLATNMARNGYRIYTYDFHRLYSERNAQPNTITNKGSIRELETILNSRPFKNKIARIYLGHYSTEVAAPLVIALIAICVILKAHWVGA